ncbi:MAG: universal stress protein [Sulfuritalea sp.]|nr:universal stress protein [Sulfuritalea sp.]
MSLKNVMVHLDSGERSAVRLEMAVSLARRHQARLMGVFGQLAEAQQIGFVATWPRPEYAAARDASRAAFAKATEGLPRTEWRDINCGSEDRVVRSIIDLARHADLVLLGQHDKRIDNQVPEELMLELILGSGRPVLLVPYIGDFPEVGRHPLIAWNNTREAARALNDALPLIESCEIATVLSLAASHEAADACCADIEKHLAAHGIKTRLDAMLVQDFGIMDMLLNRVTDRGADLLVMGAHGHIGFPFVSRGAGTRYILRHMTVPVLMSN